MNLLAMGGEDLRDARPVGWDGGGGDTRVWRGGNREVRSRAAMISQVKPNRVHTQEHQGPYGPGRSIPPFKQPINP